MASSLFPCHPDDLMVYCNGSHSSFYALNGLFKRYEHCSGQMVNDTKSTICIGYIPSDSL